MPEERETVNLALIKDGVVDSVGVFYVWDFPTWYAFSAVYDELVEVVDYVPWSGWVKDDSGQWQPPPPENNE